MKYQSTKLVWISTVKTARTMSDVEKSEWVFLGLTPYTKEGNTDELQKDKAHFKPIPLESIPWPFLHCTCTSNFSLFFLQSRFCLSFVSLAESFCITLFSVWEKCKGLMKCFAICRNCSCSVYSCVPALPLHRGRRKSKYQQTGKIWSCHSDQNENGHAVDLSASSFHYAAQNGRPPGIESSIPKKRGRRKKSEVQESQTKVETANENLIPQVDSVASSTAKKRGRKKKSDKQEIQSKTNEANVLEVESVSSVPKKRGRKKKTDVSKSGNVDDHSDSRKETSIETKSAISSGPRRRGRRRKSEEPTVMTDAEMEIELITDRVENEDEEILLNEEIKPDSGNEDEDVDEDEDGLIDTSKHKDNWPPLVCCFGPPHYTFVPIAARHMGPEFYQTEEGYFSYNPGDFARTRGGPCFSVATKLAQTGVKVALMGKLGNDVLGRQTVLELNVKNVQTRAVILDPASSTSVSRVKLFSRDGKLGMECVSPSAEESLLSSEMDLNLLKEASLFYFNSTPFLSSSLRATLEDAISFSKRNGVNTFFDVNLPMPLWESHHETWKILGQFWRSSNFIKITKQELEFLLGQEFTYRRNWMRDWKESGKGLASGQIEYYNMLSDRLSKLWHDELRLLLLNDGGALLYYTPKFHGLLTGYEYGVLSSDKSATNDVFVSETLKRLAMQPEIIENKETLEWIVTRAARIALREEDSGYRRRFIASDIDWGKHFEDLDDETNVRDNEEQDEVENANHNGDRSNDNIINQLSLPVEGIVPK